MLQNCPLPGEGTGVAQYLCGFKVKAQNGIYGTWTAFVFTMRRRAREDGRVLERLVAPPGTRLRFTSFWRRDKSPQASLGTNGDDGATLTDTTVQLRVYQGAIFIYLFACFPVSASSSLNKLLIQPRFCFYGHVNSSRLTSQDRVPSSSV